MHLRLGGCPAVHLPHQRDTREGPHIWDCLHHIVTYVDLPMWLPRKCSKSSHIILQQKEAAGPMAGPEEKIWNTSVARSGPSWSPKAYIPWQLE